MDTVRYSYLLKLNIDSEHATLFCGPTGTGKSLYVSNLLDSLDKGLYQNVIKMGFSAQTTAIQTQDIIDSKLDRRSKGVYGPKKGFKFVLFVDDLNMPAK
jgi:dynein heavy chain